MEVLLFGVDESQYNHVNINTHHTHTRTYPMWYIDSMYVLLPGGAHVKIHTHALTYIQRMIICMQVLCMRFLVEATTRDETKDTHLHTKYDNTHAGTMYVLLRGGNNS